MVGNKTRSRCGQNILVTIGFCLLVSCGGGGGTTGPAAPPPNTFSISGSVRSATGAPLSGVTLYLDLLDLSGGVVNPTSATTDVNGYYKFSNLTYSFFGHTILPSKNSYTFSPSSYLVDVSNADTPARDFVAQQTNNYSAATGGCVFDSMTGLTWEAKTADGGLRDWTNAYSNYSAAYNPVGQYGFPSDASGYLIAVNASNLCGYSDWRLPTTIELSGIRHGTGTQMDLLYIDTTWFPNTGASGYWTGGLRPNSLAYVGYVVSFGGGNVDGQEAPSLRQYVRLVRP